VNLVIEPEPLDSAEAETLLSAFSTEIASLYPGWSPDIGPSARAEEFAGEHGRFLVVRHEGRPVACGGVKRLDARTGEIKRLYVVPGLRGRGVGRELLAALEAEARSFGWERVRLDTGNNQAAALSLFTSSGYVAIEDYNANPYARYWFEKPLT
jgi:GNAT superfamily N-acetyltransferase